LIGEARNEVDQIQERWHEAVRQQKDAFLQEMKQRTSREVYSIARKAIADLANADLEQHLIDVLVSRIQENDGEVLGKTANPEAKSGQKIVVRSAFEIQDKARRQIAQTLKGQFSNDAGVEFITASDLICGIELKARDQKIAWSVNDYLKGLEESISEMIEQETGTVH
jgi:F-type H+-transporting ATPase subunit b